MSITDQIIMNEGYQNQFHVAGFYRGKWWLRNVASGCLFNEWVEAFLIAVISEFRRGDLWETIDGAYHDIHYREE